MIVNHRGDVLIYRDYQGEVERQECNSFSLYLLSTEGLKATPITNRNGISFFHINQKDLKIIASTKSNPNPAMVFEFLYTFLKICSAYFGQELSDPVIRKYYVLIYELLDEICDYGVP